MIKAAGVDHYYNAAFGIDDASLTDEPFVTALERLKQLYEDGYFNQDINSLNNNEAAALFFSGQAGFWHQGTWVTEQISSQAPEEFGGVPDAIDYTWWPAFPDTYDNSANERCSVVPNSTVAVSAQAAERGDENLENAQEFASFFGSYEAQKRFFEVTGSPVTRTDVYEEMDLDATQQTLTNTVDQLQEADAVGMVFDVAFLPETTEALLSAGQELFTGGDPASLLEDVQATNEDALSNL
jgi:ABC-type glycerol-3-phosphate transport system substrate-binding protein